MRKLAIITALALLVGGGYFYLSGAWKAWVGAKTFELEIELQEGGKEIVSVQTRVRVDEEFSVAAGETNAKYTFSGKLHQTERSGVYALKLNRQSKERSVSSSYELTLGETLTDGPMFASIDPTTTRLRLREAAPSRKPAAGEPVPGFSDLFPATPKPAVEEKAQKAQAVPAIQMKAPMPPRPVPEHTVWRGAWRDGRVFKFDVTIDLVRKGEQVEGQFYWQLTSALTYSPLAKRLGDGGVEYVRGTFDEKSRTFSVKGVQVTDAVLLGKDEYRLAVSDDGKRIEGPTKGHAGDWKGLLNGKLDRFLSEMASTGDDPVWTWAWASQPQRDKYREQIILLSRRVSDPASKAFLEATDAYLEVLVALLAEEKEPETAKQLGQLILLCTAEAMNFERLAKIAPVGKVRDALEVIRVVVLDARQYLGALKNGTMTGTRKVLRTSIEERLLDGKAALDESYLSSVVDGTIKSQDDEDMEIVHLCFSYPEQIAPKTKSATPAQRLDPGTPASDRPANGRESKSTSPRGPSPQSPVKNENSATHPTVGGKVPR